MKLDRRKNNIQVTHRRRSNDETWIQTHWRAMMAWQYFIVCLFDFMLAPIAAWYFAYYTKTTLITWVPLTTSGGGLYHLAMGAIIGITSWSRTKEKIFNTQSLESEPPGPPTTEPPIQPAPVPVPVIKASSKPPVYNDPER